MEKENGVHIYNEILFSHKNEWNWVIVDNPGVSETEWSTSERKKKYFIVTLTWNL